MLFGGDEVDEQVLSLRETLRVVLRYRRVVTILAAIGLVVGLGVALSLPTLVSAKSLVLLPSSPIGTNGAPVREVQTDVLIALSPTVLMPAAQKAGVHLPYATLLKHVSITSITDDVVSIVAKASSATQAEALSNAIANQFLSYTAGQAGISQSGVEAELTVEENELNSDISTDAANIKIDTKTLSSINPSSPDYTSLQNVINTYAADEGNENNELINVKTELSSAETTGNTQGLDAIVLQKANTATKPSPARFPELGAFGLGIGLIIGLVVALVKGRKDTRLRQRDDIARATGVPVIASVSSIRPNKSDDLLGVLEDFEPSVADRASLRRLIDEMGVPRHYVQNGARLSQNGSSAHSEGLDVWAFVLEGDDKAISAAAGVPAFAASIGVPVALVVGGTNRSTHQLAIACAARDPLDPGASRPNFLTYASVPSSPPTGVSLTVTLEVVNPLTLDVGDIEAPIPSVDRVSTAILVVSAGFARSDELEVVALAAEHHGRPLTGVVVADPEPSDKTSGMQQARVVGIGAQRRTSSNPRSTAR
jgi:capsular polysaccharide biosynthesis protein